MPFQFEPLKIPGVILIQPETFHDERGFLMETYRYSDFAVGGITVQFVQDIHSHSRRGVLRGLHYQNCPKVQGKLVRVAAGIIFDVAVDIRRGSPSYGQWIGITLSEENKKMLYIPAGFAHGFCVLSDTADVVYKTTEEYSPKHDSGIIWNDPDIDIHWPLTQPIISAKDARLPRLAEADNTFIYVTGATE